MNFNYCIDDKEIKFYYAKGQSLMSGNEFHEFHEILFIFHASGSFLSENEKTQPVPDMLVLIPKETYHSFVFSEKDDYLRCRIWFSKILDFNDFAEECMSDIRVISEFNGMFKKLFSELAEICLKTCSEDEKKLLLRSSVLRILYEIKNNHSTFNPLHTEPQSVFIQNAVSIIDKCYRENISVADIAKRLFVSPSQLSHTFKNELNISVHRYITLKRLLYAQKLIKNGIGATDAARQCGFCEYSSFYRNYKKHYGISPCKAE